MSQPLVSIVMGSESDLPVMVESARILEDLQIPFEIIISSAHRTPVETERLASSAEARGIKVIIAGAGGAAHLPGVIAAQTTLPVIGVPMKTETLNGIDSLYSIVQMPAGVPVGCMAINGARNAGIFAAQILALEKPEIKHRLDQYKQDLADKVRAKNHRLQNLGAGEYIRELGKKDQ